MIEDIITQNGYSRKRSLSTIHDCAKMSFDKQTNDNQNLMDPYCILSRQILCIVYLF